MSEIKHMNRVTLIQCTKRKRDGEWPAKRLYDESRYFRRMKEWAEARDNPWFILSAKYGLVEPDETVCDYDETGLTEDEAKGIAEDLEEQGVTTVDITGGKSYTLPLTPELEAKGIDVIEHFAGERIGDREKLLQQAKNELIHDNIA